VEEGDGRAELEAALAERRSELELGIGDQFGIEELQCLAACLDRAAASDEDVLYPLHVGPVREEEEKCVAAPEHVHRRAIQPAR
jgi:hypothetical protein